MQPAYAQHQVFPDTLDAVPADARVSEAIPFTPGALAIGGVLGLIGSSIGLATYGVRRLEDLYVPGGCLLGAVLFGTWEVMRRRRRVAIAFNGNQLGIYRGGKLSETAYRSQLTIYQLSFINTFRELFAFGILAVFGLFAGFLSIGHNASTGLVMLGGGVGMAGAFGSSIYARILCRQIFVPKNGTTEQVGFVKSDLGRFGI
jgi:hypothetical protein